MSILPASNVINVTLTSTPSGLSVPNVNSIALITTELPNNLEAFRVYTNARDVATDYGSDSVTYKMANAVFAQAPNILTGNGRLVVAPMLSAVSATSGFFVTANISANLAALIAVTNGYIRVTLDGANIDLAGLDFTRCTTLAEIAAVLQAELPNAIVTSTSTTFTVKSKKVGADADVVLLTYTASGTNLAASGFFNTAGGTATSGADSSGETLIEAIDRVSEVVQFIPVITNLEMEDDVIQDTADGMQSRDNIWVHHFVSTSDITNICSDIAEAFDTHTRCVLYTVSPAEANLMKSAYAGRGFSVDFSGSATTQTMQLKSLTTILADDGINQTIRDAALENGVDIYPSVGGLACLLTSGANDYFDNVYNSLWFKLAIQVAGFNFLRQTNTKVPQDEPGMDGLKGAYASVCNQAVNNRMIGLGLTWNSSETFGNPDDFRRNITQNGYYIYSAPVALQSQEDRDDRIAPLVQIAVKLSGAIHKSNVLVLVQE